eukprot:12280925-Alexandrium_andersonii.AAC.1
MDVAPWHEIAASAKARRESFAQGQASAAVAGPADSSPLLPAQPTARLHRASSRPAAFPRDFDLRLRVEQAAS